MTKPKTPEVLSVAGKALWSEVTAKYTLRPDELVTLEDYCAIADEIADLLAEHEEMGRPRMTKGSMGQLVEHPIPKRLTDLRMKRNTLAKQLKLPDAPGGSKPNQQRDAANSRWASAHGATA